MSLEPREDRRVEQGRSKPGSTAGPLAGIKIIEFAGLGPGPMAAMQLADMGATVLRIERMEPVELGVARPLRFDTMLRNRTTIALDLKDASSVELVLELVESADALIEGFRPGVMERLGLGPDVCLARRPQLVYGRVTGWGQSGPLAHSAGHDINYIALTGALNAIGRKGQPPSIPLALVGDFGGGAMFLVSGVLAALLRARIDGKGQVVDAAIVDGAASLATSFFALDAAGMWRPERGSNWLDSGAPFYDVYECQDGRWLSVGPIEKRFYVEMLSRVGAMSQDLGDVSRPDTWPRIKAELARIFRTKTLRQWCEELEGTDACCAPVLSFAEAGQHPHLKARETLISVDGVVQPAPAPRFSATPSAKPSPPREPQPLEQALAGWLPAGRVAAQAARAA